MASSPPPVPSAIASLWLGLRRKACTAGANKSADRHPRTGPASLTGGRLSPADLLSGENGSVLLAEIYSYGKTP
ncbi:hypothetical protein PSAC2689_50410 [Paraburkholderia sacchari]